MAHFMTMFDAREHLGAWDLGGKDRVVEIVSVKPGTIGRGKDKSKKPILTVKTGKGAVRTMACNITNAKTIKTLFGSDTDAWVGKRIALYPTTATFGSEVHDAIRIRPQAPGDKVAMTEFAEVSPEEREAHLAKLDKAAGRAADGELTEDEERAQMGGGR
jgi:hypothetical protein